MIRLESGEDLVFHDFTIGDEFLIPDSGSINVRLTSINGGTPYTDTVPYTDSEVVIAASEFSSFTNETFFMYTLSISFTAEGKRRTLKEYVRVEKPATIFMTEDNVRSALGVSMQELPNEDIDLFIRYTKINKTLGVDILGGDFDVTDANDLILYEECLAQVFFLELKLLKSTEADDIRKSRLGKFDFEAMRSRFETLVRSLRLEFDETAEEAPTQLVEVVARTDPFAGA